MSIHFCEIHDKINQNNTEKKNICQKIKLEEDLNINNKINKKEKSIFEKYKNLDEEVKKKKEIELKKRRIERTGRIKETRRFEKA